MGSFEQQLRRLQPGLVVLDISGSVVGKVVDRAADRFAVATGSETVSLRPDCLYTVTEHTVVLLCHQSRIATYQTD